MSCDSPSLGYICRPEISRDWAQYSPYYSVRSDISDEVPETCEITFAQLLSRHGARSPTETKNEPYRATISKLMRNVAPEDFRHEYEFLRGWRYNLSVAELTQLGKQQLYYSGEKFQQRYANLARSQRPFVRSADRSRVVESAQNWLAGYYHDQGSPHHFSPDVRIPEGPGINNTLAHGACDALESGRYSRLHFNAKANWLSRFGPSIMNRLNDDLPRADLNLRDIVNLMELCPADTVDSPEGTISPFCDLFTEHEWQEFNYFGTLTKYYKTGAGNPVGPAQGIGFVNELIARMKGERVADDTSTNRSLDSNPETFPVGDDHRMFADFTHDSDMTSIFFVLNLYPWKPRYDQASMEYFNTTSGLYDPSHATPFAARAYFEKMQCQGEPEELVRIIVNDKVMPQPACSDGQLGRCKLSDFISSLSFATSMGNWADCFKAGNLVKSPWESNLAELLSV